MCTNLSIERKSDDYPVISARTMDFTVAIPTAINFVPRCQSFPEAPLRGEIQWKNKYGFVGTLHTLFKESGYSDGLNEVGLSAAALWLECTTSLPLTASYTASILICWTLTDQSKNNFPSNSLIGTLIVLINSNKPQSDHCYNLT